MHGSIREVNLQRIPGLQVLRRAQWPPLRSPDHRISPLKLGQGAEVLQGLGLQVQVLA